MESTNYEIKSYTVQAGKNIDSKGQHNTTTKKQYELYIDGGYVNTYSFLKDAKMDIELYKNGKEVFYPLGKEFKGSAYYY